MPTLILPIKHQRGKPNPTAFRVPQEVFDRFLHLEQAYELDPSIINQIEAATRVFNKRQDRRGKKKTIEEVKTIAKELFK